MTEYEIVKNLFSCGKCNTNIVQYFFLIYFHMYTTCNTCIISYSVMFKKRYLSSYKIWNDFEKNGVRYYKCYIDVLLLNVGLSVEPRGILIQIISHLNLVHNFQVWNVILYLLVADCCICFDVSYVFIHMSYTIL